MHKDESDVEEIERLLAHGRTELKALKRIHGDHFARAYERDPAILPPDARIKRMREEEQAKQSSLLHRILNTPLFQVR